MNPPAQERHANSLRDLAALHGPAVLATIAVGWLLVALQPTWAGSVWRYLRDHLPWLGGPERGLVASDKAIHLLLFFALTACLVRSTQAWAHLRTALPIAWTASTAYGAALELAQAFLPHRSGEIADLIADAAGASLLVGLLLVRRRFRPTRL